MEGLVKEHGYAIGEQEVNDEYLLTESEDEIIIRPHLNSSPSITDRVPVQHPIRMDGTSTHGLRPPRLRLTELGNITILLG